MHCWYRIRVSSSRIATINARLKLILLIHQLRVYEADLGERVELRGLVFQDAIHLLVDHLALVAHFFTASALA
jgi:hypothetical protein